MPKIFSCYSQYFSLLNQKYFFVIQIKIYCYLIFKILLITYLNLKFINFHQKMSIKKPHLLQRGSINFY